MLAALEDLEPLTMKLGRLAELDEDDRLATQTLPLSIKSLRQNAYLVREGDGASACCVLIDG